MQIICNNCGNDLIFPNERYLVTCPHCLTHLQIEELENTISATIIENPDFTKLNLSLSNELSTIQSLAPLYNLLHLENKHSDNIEENFFRSILFGKRFRPVLVRAISRLIFSFMFFLMALSGGGLYDGHFGAILTTIYSLFLFRVGIIEGLRWWRLWRFERYFFDEQAKLMTEVEALDLSPKLAQLFANYQKNHRSHLQIRQDYFYYHFLKFKIYIGTSVLSQAFRLIPLGAFMAIILFNLFNSYIVVILCMLPLIVLFGIIISKSSDHNHLYTKILNDRKDIIQQLNNYLSR